MESQSSFWLMWRSVLKFIVHKCSGQTELERLSRSGDVLAFERSLRLSKQLTEYKQQHCHWQEPYHPDQAQQLCATKNITDRDAKFRVENMLRVLHSWKFAISFLQRIRQVRYSQQAVEHEEMLMRVWEALRPQRQIRSRISEEWIELGFQGDNPATDFRGAGLLGLVNLVGWVCTPEGKEAFRVAETPGTDYFFASASLFMTMLSLQVVKGALVTPAFWVTEEGESPELLFQRVFEQVWREFVLFWAQVADKSMMQFNLNLQSFARLIKEQRAPAISQRLMSKSLRHSQSHS